MRLSELSQSILNVADPRFSGIPSNEFGKDIPKPALRRLTSETPIFPAAEFLGVPSDELAEHGCDLIAGGLLSLNPDVKMRPLHHLLG